MRNSPLFLNSIYVRHRNIGILDISDSQRRSTWNSATVRDHQNPPGLDTFHDITSNPLSET